MERKLFEPNKEAMTIAFMCGNLPLIQYLETEMPIDEVCSENENTRKRLKKRGKERGKKREKKRTMNERRGTLAFMCLIQ